MNFGSNGKFIQFMHEGQRVTYCFPYVTRGVFFLSFFLYICIIGHVIKDLKKANVPP